MLGKRFQTIRSFLTQHCGSFPLNWIDETFYDKLSFLHWLYLFCDKRKTSNFVSGIFIPTTMYNRFDAFGAIVSPEFKLSKTNL